MYHTNYVLIDSLIGKAIKFWESQKLYRDFPLGRVGDPNTSHPIVQESTVFWGVEGWRGWGRLG